MMSLVLIDPRKIQPDPENVRRDTTDDLDGLARSIREHGLLQPLGVAQENGGFRVVYGNRRRAAAIKARSEEHTSELQSRQYLVCRLLLEKKNACEIN